MPKFVRKLAVVEAEQLEWNKVPSLVMADDETTLPGVLAYYSEIGTIWLDLETPQGTVTIKPGDWVILDKFGNMFPCPTDVFDRNYDPVDD